MPTPLLLHYAPDNASLCVRLALAASGTAYCTALVDRGARAQESAAYRRLNPNRLIPVLETPDGPIFETAAILLWLSEQPEGAGLMPAAGAAVRGAALAWLFWLSNTLHPTLRMLFYPEKFAPRPAQASMTETTQRRLAAHLDILDGQAATAPDWLRPGAGSAHVCYLCPMLRWPALYPQTGSSWFDLARWPHLHEIARVTERTPWARATAALEGLGDTPFSLPSPPAPPEGSAL